MSGPSETPAPPAGWDVGVIHATLLSITPLAAALERELPRAQVRHLLDDSLLVDLNAAGRLTASLRARMERLVEHLVADGVRAVQLACSGYAPVVEELRARVSTPVLKPDEAMYRQLAAGPHHSVGLLATVKPALDLAEDQLRRCAAEWDRDVSVVGRCEPAALAAANRGDRGDLERLLADAAVALAADGVDALALVQYSMSPAADAVVDATGLPVHTGPGAAARHLREVLTMSGADAAASAGRATPPAGDPLRGARSGGAPR